MDQRIPFIGTAIFALIIIIFIYSKISGKEYPKNLFYLIKDSNDISKIFARTPAELEKRVHAAIADAKTAIDAIIEIDDDQRTFANTMQAFDAITSRSDLAIISGSAAIIYLVHPDRAMREKAQAIIEEISTFATAKLENNPALYAAIKSYVQQKAPMEQLSEEQLYYIDELMKQFKRSGLELPEDKQTEIRALKNGLTTIGLQFETNINNDGNKTIVLSRKELQGVPDYFIDSLEKTKDGSYLVPINYATYDRIMATCQIADTRKKLWLVFNNRAYPANEEVLKQLIAKEDKLAHLVNYKNYAALSLEETMAASPSEVDEFIDNLAVSVLSKANEEFAILTYELPESVELTSDGKIYPWDFGYLQEHYKKSHLQLDEQKIAEYFPMEKTIDGLMKVYAQFFNLEFTKLSANNLWDDKLTILRIADRAQNKCLGYLILDLYPRNGKFSHACQDKIIPALEITGQEDRPWLGIIIANFDPSTAQKPSLLKRQEVGTFFHELGHAMHSILGRQSLGYFSGTHVKFDFIEVPSQMFEEWLYDPEVLRVVSGHYETGAPLPDDIINKIIANKSLTMGSFVQRQCYLSKLALSYFQGAHPNIQEIFQRFNESMCPAIAFMPENHNYAAFGHLVGYGPRYYSYMWSKFIALDLAAEIKKAGFLNPAVGGRLRKQILSKGGSQGPRILIHNFLGRDFNDDAFLKDIGIQRR